VTRKVTILMYHQVGDFPPMKAHRSTYCHYKSFARQMAYLHWLGYKVIALEEALNGLFGGGSLPDRSVVLTFDDGYENFNEYAFPVLKRYGFAATVFLVSGLLGDKARWLEADGRLGARLMDGETIRALARQRITFGAHTVNHVRLSKLEPERMREEIVRSKTELESVLDEEVRYFCYPYGDYSAAAVETVRQSGFDAALSCIRGDAKPSDDRFLLPRKAISFGDNLVGYFWKIHVKKQRKRARAAYV